MPFGLRPATLLTVFPHVRQRCAENQKNVQAGGGRGAAWNQKVVLTWPF